MPVQPASEYSLLKMALASLASSAGVGLVNATLNAPMSRGRAVCNEYYGRFPTLRDCSVAIAGMATGAEEVVYAVDGRTGKLHLPQAIKFGDCMVQMEMAGPRVPPRISFVPDELRSRANWVSTTCNKDGDSIGGFVTSSLASMAGWLTSPEGELDAPMPLYTSFLTISVSTPHPEYISPGNYDPTLAYIFALSEFDAAAMMPSASRMADKLRKRGDRLLKQQKVMAPRGRRIPWWGNPDQSEVRNSTGGPVVEMPTGGGGTTESARKRRRRRGEAVGGSNDGVVGGSNDGSMEESDGEAIGGSSDGAVGGSEGETVGGSDDRVIGGFSGGAVGGSEDGAVGGSSEGAIGGNG
ncbi:MAG: hypothetical protein Q9222_002191 [Ikaeria aurantiellina]